MTIQDLILRDSWGWTVVLWNTARAKINGLKICGSRVLQDDAVDLVNSKNIVIQDSFFRAQDDIIAVKCMKGYHEPVRNNLNFREDAAVTTNRSQGAASCENILIENCQFWTDIANIFRIGYECEARKMRAIQSKNIDVLHYSKNCRDPEDPWSNAIIWLQPSQNLTIEDCSFENIRVRSDGNDICMLIAKPMSCNYGEYTDPEPGNVKNCSFKNIQVFGDKGIFKGLIYLRRSSSSHNVEQLSFEGINYFGKTIDNRSDFVFTGDFVEKILFDRQ